MILLVVKFVIFFIEYIGRGIDRNRERERG